MSSAWGYTQLFNTNRHGTIQSIIFEILFSTAAFGSIGRIYQAVQLDISGWLIFSKLNVIFLVLVKGSIVELIQRAVYFRNRMPKDILIELPVCLPLLVRIQ